MFVVHNISLGNFDNSEKFLGWIFKKCLANQHLLRRSSPILWVITPYLDNLSIDNSPHENERS